MKNHVKHRYKVAAMIRKYISPVLASKWIVLINLFSAIFQKICKYEEHAKLTDTEVLRLEWNLKRFIVRFYGFIKKYAKPASDSNILKKELNVGIKIHFLKHVVDYVKVNGNLRIAYFNEELTEHNVQHIARTFYSYRSFFGEKREKCGMRKVNMGSAPHYFCPKVNYK